MQGEAIPREDSVARLCGETKLSEDKKRTLAGAWKLSSSDRKSPEPHLSVNWLEFFANACREEQLENIRHILAKKMSRVPRNGRLAVLTVEEIHRAVSEVGQSVRVLHQPSDQLEVEDLSHSGIFDVEQDEDVIAQALSRADCELVAALSRRSASP